MSTVTLWLVPMLPGLRGGIGIPMTLPLAFADAEVETPVICGRNPGKATSDVPLERCVNALVRRPVHGDQPGWPTEREEVGIAARVGAQVELLPPPPETSRAGMVPKPSRKVQKKNRPRGRPYSVLAGSCWAQRRRPWCTRRGSGR